MSTVKQKVKGAVLAPQWWIELPTNVRAVESLSVFGKRLKTYLFRLHLASDMSWFLPCEKCTYYKSLWTKVCAKCPKCKCKW